MPTLTDLRATMPELAGLDDQHAVKLIHQLYYPQQDPARIAGLLGVKPAAPPKPERSLLRASADVGLSALRGVGTGVRMLTDVAGADNVASGALRSVDDYLRSLQSATANANEAEVARLLKEAEGQGVLDQVVAGAKAFAVDPVSMLANAVGTAVPTLAAGAVGAAARVGAVGAAAASGGVGAAQGVGAVKGSIYDTVKQELRAAGASEQEAEDRAVRAQEYSSANAGQIAVGGALGALAGSTGAERIVASMRGAAGTGPARGALARMATGAVTEAVPEALQAGQEKFATNTALNNEGFQVSPMSGVAANMTVEGLAGAGVGGSFGLANRSAGDAIRATKLPESGAVSKALNAGTEEAAQVADAEEAAVVQAHAQTRRQQAAPMAAALGRLGDADRTEALNALAVADNMQAPPAVRRRAQNRLDVLMALAETPAAAADVAPEAPDAESLVAPASVPETDVAAAAEPSQPTEAQAPPITGQPRPQYPDPLPGERVYSSMDVAMRVKARSGEGAELVRVVGGLAVRKTDHKTGEVTIPASTAEPAELPGVEPAPPAPADPPALPDDTLNRAGNPFTHRGAAANRMRELGDGWTTAKVQGGFAVRRLSAVSAPVDASAQQAATSPTNDLFEPTDGQKKAGNYKLGHHRVSGLDLSIENPAGSVRRGTDRDGKAWENTLQHHYGYIKGSRGADKDHVDVFVKPGTADEWAGTVFVVDQVHPDTGKFDEHKALIGFDTIDEAKAAYAANYAKGWKGLKAISAMPANEFRTWALSDAPARGPLVKKQPTLMDKMTEEAGGPLTFGDIKRMNAEADLEPPAAAPVTQPPVKAETVATPVATAPTAPPANDADSGAAEREAVSSWASAPAEQRQQWLLEAGWKKGSPGLAAMEDKPWTGMTPSQRSRVRAAIEASEKRRVESWGKPQRHPAAEPEPKPRKVPVPVQRAAAEREAKRAAYFTSGNVVEGYGGFDEVLEYRPPGEDGRGWAVKVHGVVKGQASGQWVRVGKPQDARWHSTEPEARNFAKGPVAQLTHVPGELVSYTEGRVDGRPFPNAPDRGVKAAEPVSQPKEEASATSQALVSQPNPAPAPTPAPAPAPTPSANTIFTDDAAAAARARLKAKLGRLNSGIDPEMLMDGITLAGYHIEKGARTFAGYAKAMVADLGDAVKPYLQSWYMAVRSDPRAAEFRAGMDKASAVEDMTAADIDAVLEEAQNAAQEPDDGNAARPLDRPGQRALEGAPADPVQAPDAGRDAGRSPEGSSSADGGRSGSAEGTGGPDRGVGDGAGAPPVPARGERRKPRGESKPRAGRNARPDADPGLFGDGAGPDPQELTAPNVAPPAPPAFTPVDFEIADDLALGEGGQKAKYRGNVEAIRLLRDLDATGRTATQAEQRVLARYVGWGGIAQAFDAGNRDWAREHAELKELLTPEEWAKANESTQYAHYTSREVIGGIYEALARMGFTGGKILEPGSGVGNFVGLMPATLRTSSRFTGVEREAIAVGIAKHLYPQQNIQRADFTEFIGNDGFFDLAIGNPPFARNPLTDKSGRKHLTGLSVHNYFFAKAVDMLREGGILAQVVSNSFLDAKRDTARRYIADRTEFLGAIRLPNNAFAKNANTEVTTDIVFLRKLPESEWGSRSGKENRDRWLDTQNITDPNGGDDIPVNRYFAENPEMMLGQMGRFGTMYGPGQPALVAKPGQDTAALLKAAIARLPADVYIARAVANTAAMGDAAIVALRDPKVQEGGYYVEGGKLYQRQQDIAGEARAVELTPDSQWTEKTKLGEEGFTRIKLLAGLRQTLRDLLAAELADAKDIAALRSGLNEEYDAYVAKHGLINDKPSARVFDDDPDYPLLASLEHGFTPGITLAAAKKMGVKPMPATAKKGPIFSARVIEKRTAPSRAESPADALNISMAERGRIDASYIGELLGRDGDEALREMSQGAKPLLFMDPASNEYVLRDAYLSGNVRAKLAQARQAGMMNNARALEDVQPPDVSAGEISVRVGSPWVPAFIYEDFARHLFGEGTKATFTYVKANSSYMATLRAGSDVADSTTWGTKDYPGTQILTSLMNNREIKVMYLDENKSLKVHREATEAANQKATEVKQAFSDWAFSDADRADVLARAYNEANNNYVTRAFDGGYMQFPGKVPDAIIKFRRHQRNAIARIVQDRTALLDHVVGAGKTFTVISAAMELKRTGLSNKPLIVVPNHLVKQWAADFYRLYPGANILTATKKDFEKVNRRRFLAKIATGNWDAVIMAHSSFGFVKPASEFEAQFNEKQVENVLATIQAVEDGDGDAMAKKRTVKQLAALKERLENRIDALRQKPIDALLDFKEIGVDQLFVDEAHLFKNLMFTTKMQNVRGLGDSAGSQRAYDLFIKANQLYAQNGRGQGVVFATGTPVSNSLAEMYHMMRYLMPQALQDGGFESFDAWANTFASVEQVWMQKISADGFKADNRMSNFVNTHELLKMFDQVADTVTMDDIKRAYTDENNGAEFPLPKLKNGRRQPVSLVKSPAQEAYMADVAARAAAIEGKRTNEKGMDNALKIMGDARKAAMDIRLVDMERTEREKGGRIDRAAEEIEARYRQYADVKGTQLVFSDLGTPIKHAKAEMKEWEALQERIGKAVDPEIVTAANLGNEAAMKAVEDAEDAQREMDEKGADWLDAVKAALRGFSVYDDLRTALVERGIPESEIAFIHDYNTDEQKLSLFRKVNTGEIRVLMGSTPKLGAGTNVQERLVALHHLDVPWKPSDVEQREGRIIRQGNMLMNTLPGFEVEILAYVTQDTLDMRMWQVQETKLKMINQLRTRQIGREIDNAFEDMEMSAGEMQAAATGNMDLLKEIQLRTDVKKLEQAKRSYDAQRNDLASRKKRAEEAVAALPRKIEKAERMAAASKAYINEQQAPAAAFRVEIDGTTYTDAKKAGAVLQAVVDAKQYVKKGSDQVLTPEQYQSLAEEERSAGNGWTERPVPLKLVMDGKTYTARAALGEAFADLRGDAVDPPMLKVDGQTFNRRTKAAAAIAQRVADAIAESRAVEVGKIGPFGITVEGQGTSRFDKGSYGIEVLIAAPDGVEASTTLSVRAIASEDDARKAATSVINAAIGLASGGEMQARWLREELTSKKKVLADIAATKPMTEFPQQAKLEQARAAHREVLERLTAKAKETPPADAGDADDAAALSRGTGAVGMPLEQAQAIADRIAGAAGSTVRVRVARNVDELTGPAAAAVQALSPQGPVRGAYLPGQDEVWLFADHVSSEPEAMFVVLHEAFHRGFSRTVTGGRALLQDLWRSNQSLRRAAAEQMQQHKIGRDEAIEEALADMAGRGEASTLTGWAKFVNAVRVWLAKVASAIGVPMTWTDDMVQAFVAQTARQGLRAKGSVLEASGTFDLANSDIRFSRVPERALRDAATGGAKALSDLKLAAGYQVGDFFTSHAKLSFWDKTVGTPFNLAKRFPDTFGRVYDATQRFLEDVSATANAAADLAPRILPKLEHLKDIWKSPLKPEDEAAIRKPIFEGTLLWLRGPDGKLQKAADAKRAALSLDAESKARAMLRAGKLDERVLKMWQGLPLDRYEAMVESRYESQMLRAGVVFTDAELKTVFKLTADQASLYREFRKAADKSLNDLAVSEMIRLGGARVKGLADAVRGLSAVDASTKLRDALFEQSEAARAEGEKVRGGDIDDTADRIVQIGNKVRDLTANGYAPLMRFGHYTVDVVDGDERVYFGMFESQAEANRMARSMRGNFPDAKVTQGTQSQEAYKLFAGVNPETVELFGEILGLGQGGEKQDAAFQEYLKRAQSNRSALTRLIHRKGIKGFDEEVGRVLAGFITSNARRTSSNLHTKDILEAVEQIPKETGELKDYAGRMAEYTRNPIEEAQAFRGLLFVQYLGGSIASALVNMTQPITVSFPFLSQFGGAGRAAKALTKAYADMAGGRNFEAGLDEALRAAEDGGIVAPQELFQLLAQAQGKGQLRTGDGTVGGDAAAAVQNAKARALLVWGKMFSFAELINRKATFIAAYRMAQARGEADPAAFAADAVKETQFTYNKGNRPEWARGAIGATLFTFKTYSVSYVELLARQWRLGGPDGRKAMLLGIATLALVAGMDGLPFMEDVEDVIDGFMQRVMGRNFATRQARNEFLSSVMGEDLARFVAKGVSGLPGAPLDVSGRLGLGNLIPGTGLLRKDASAANSLKELAGPAGDFIQRGFNATGMALQGDIGKAVVEISPVAARNVVKAADMVETGMYRDTSGKKIIDTSSAEALLKGIGFQPNSVARVQAASNDVRRMVELNKRTEAEIADQWALGIFEGDTAKVAEAIKRRNQWNEDNPKTPIRIEMSQVLRRVRQMRMTKAERMAKTAPKEIREAARRELEGVAR